MDAPIVCAWFLPLGDPPKALLLSACRGELKGIWAICIYILFLIRGPHISVMLHRSQTWVQTESLEL